MYLVSDLDCVFKPYICTTDKQPSDDEQINSVSCWTWDRQQVVEHSRLEYFVINLDQIE